MSQATGLLNNFGQRLANMRAGLTRRLMVHRFAAAESHFSGRVCRVPRGPVGKTTLGVSIACTIALAIAGCLGLPGASERELKPRQGTETKDKEGTMAEESFKYGFRCDPMKFVATSDSLQAALVRRVVLNRPKPGDDEVIEAHFKEILAKQRPDGSIAHFWIDDRVDTEIWTRHLVEMGCPKDRPEIKRALDAIRREATEGKSLRMRDLCVLGLTDLPVVKESIPKVATAMEKGLGPNEGCPGGPISGLMTLWAVRHVENVDAALTKGLEWMDSALEDPGCSLGLGFCEPWSIVNMVAVIDHPVAKRIARKLVPMLLRLQESDGSWGEKHWDAQGKYSTLWAFQALERHGLFDELRKLPPLPPDWEVVNSIPAPGEKPRNIVWSSGNLWVLDVATWSAIAVSPTDGKVLKTVKLTKKPSLKHFGFGAGDGTFFLVGVVGKEWKCTVYEMDVETGKVVREMPLSKPIPAAAVVKVEEKLLVADGWEGGVWVVDLNKPDAEPQRARIAATMPDFMASHRDEVWAVDCWAPAIIRTNLDGDLLDWGEKPFGFNPVAWDGKRLWALDPKNDRICQIEKSESGRGLKPKRKAEAPAEEADLEYGFRYDPIKFVEEDQSLQGALVRTFISGKPKPDDKKLIQQEIDKILADQLADGRLSDHERHGMQFTAEKLIRVAEMGCPASRPEMQKAVAALRAKCSDEDPEHLGIYGVRAFCLLGLAHDPKVRDGLERCMAREKEWNNPHAGCPWTPIEHLITLWHGRQCADVLPILEKALTWIADRINPAGCLSYKDPWGFVRLASQIDHPLARVVLEKEVPMLLRAQRAGGGWGDRSYIAFRALKRHGLLDKLHGLPSLPDDWQISRSVPAPEGNLFTMTWGGGRLWVYDKEAKQAIAVSPDDGKVLKTVKLPVGNVFGIGWWDDALVVTQQKPKKLVQVDPDTGAVKRELSLEDRLEEVGGVTQVAGRLWVADGFNWNVCMMDPAEPAKPRYQLLACPCGGYGTDLACAGDGVWHFDRSMAVLVKSGLDGRLLEWAGKPFGDATAGIAWDGRQLWALDAKNKRICAIEKTATAPKPKRAAATTSAEARAAALTEDHRKKLNQWRNIRSVADIVKNTDKEPVFFELLDLELSLDPVSEDAAAIRRAMTELEPADLTYWPLIEAIVKAIGGDRRPPESVRNGKLVRPVPGWAERKQQIRKRARAMEEWLKGTAVEAAKKAEGTDAATVEEAYGLLGKPNADRKRLVKLTIEKMDRGEPNKDEIEAVRKSRDLGEFAHRIEMLDAPLWSYDRNFKLLLGDIGRGRVTGEWHKPGGPLAWRDANPADRPKVAAALDAVDAWLAGKGSSHEFAAVLGKRDAYKEKVWLARCLRTYLRVQLDEYYAAPTRQPAAGSATLKGHEYRFVRLTPDSLFDVELVRDGKGLYGEACQQLWGKTRRPPYTEGPDAYCGGHVWPLYNLDQDIPRGELKPVDDQIGEFWFELGRDLKGKAKQFGLLAYADGKLAGKIRFYPKTLTRAHWGGWSEEEHRREWRDDILWIGSGYVDPQGIEDALDVELIRRVVEYARTEGFVKIQATGWGEAVPYAMWGESFRASAFRPHGFRTVAKTGGCPDAFEHMINGCHGKWCSDLMREAIGKGISCDTGHQCRIVELDLTVPKPEPESEDAASRLPEVMGETALHEAARHAHVDTAQWLIEKGANVNAKDAKGRTPLDHAKTVEMEALLHKHGAKPGPGQVKPGGASRFERSGRMAVIRGLEKMDWGGSFWARQDSFMACFTEVLRCTGRDVTYAEVMGLSGAAFKLTTGEDNWCPSQAICDVGADCPDQALRAFGFAREIIDLNEEKNPGGTEKARKAIVASIDRGLPVMYMDGERSLVVGYREGGKTFICMPYAGSKDGYKDMPKLRGMLGDAWFVEVLRREGEPPKRREAIVGSLRNALQLARTPSLEKDTTNGLAAYETWVKKLRNPPEKPNLHGHAYVTSILLTSRRAAADYLRKTAKEVKPEAAKHLLAAADRYEGVAKRLWKNRGLMKHPWDKSWTPENRAKEAEVMLANLTDERAAVAEIEEAFASNQQTGR